MKWTVRSLIQYCPTLTSLLEHEAIDSTTERHSETLRHHIDKSLVFELVFWLD